MSKVTVTRTIAAAPDAVWNLIGDPAAMAKWHPAIESSTLHGNRVTYIWKDGTKVLEEVTARTANTVAYKLVEAPVPVSTYAASLHVDPSGTGTLVTWEATFEAAPGAPAAEIEAMIRGMFEAGLGSAEAMLVAK